MKNCTECRHEKVYNLLCHARYGHKCVKGLNVVFHEELNEFDNKVDQCIDYNPNDRFLDKILRKYDIFVGHRVDFPQHLIHPNTVTIDSQLKCIKRKFTKMEFVEKKCCIDIFGSSSKVWF